MCFFHLKLHILWKIIKQIENEIPIEEDFSKDKKYHSNTNFINNIIIECQASIESVLKLDLHKSME
jgi:hypothetical protein